MRIFFFGKMVHVKQLALSVSQAMTWVNDTCSSCCWVLAEEIKVTEDLLINTLVDPP